MSRIAPRVQHLKCGESVTIRSAVPVDAAAVLAHARAVIGESGFLITQPDEFNLTEEQERDWIQQHLDDPRKLAIVAETDGGIVGMLGFEAGERRRLAHRGTLHMTVHQDWRGRGIGALLLQAAIDWGTEHPTIEKLSLAVLETNTIALGLYRKLGFVVEGRRVREIKLGPNEYLDDLLMCRFV